MKRSIYFITITLQALFVLVSCEKTIDFKGGIIDPKITINGIIVPDEFVSVHVAKSYSIQNDSEDRDKIDSAKADLYENDVWLETLKGRAAVISGHYASFNEINFYSETTKPQIGKSYRIEVSATNLPKASGTTSIPTQVEIIKIDTATTNTSENGYNQSALTVYATFKDIPNEKNYYKLNIRSFSGSNPTKYSNIPNKNLINITAQNIYADFSKEPLLNPQGSSTDIFDSSTPNDQNIFTDELISNKEYTLRINIPSYFYSNQQIDTSLNEFFMLIIEIETLNSDYYKYIQSSNLQAYTQGSPFTEPVQVFTNIKNGVGIFSSKVSSPRSFLIGKYPVEGVSYNNYDPTNPIVVPKSTTISD